MREVMYVHSRFHPLILHAQQSFSFSSLVLGVVLEVLDYTTDLLVFKLVATTGLEKPATEPLVVP